MYYQDQAIILNRRVFRDDDLLVTFFSGSYGKISAVAVGAKKIKSKLAGHLEPINLVELNWVVGKAGEKLIGAQAIQSFRKIKENYDKIILSTYFLEIIDKTCKSHHQDKKIFEFLKNVFMRLNAAPADELEIIKISFEYKLLYLLGYDPRFRQRLIKMNLQNAAQQIIESSINKIKNTPLIIQDIKKLDIKAKDFFQEIVENKIISAEMIV